jgi:hypothetical protein
LEIAAAPNKLVAKCVVLRKIMPVRTFAKMVSHRNCASPPVRLKPNIKIDGTYTQRVHG